jgi:hypothetical protein
MQIVTEKKSLQYMILNSFRTNISVLSDPASIKLVLIFHESLVASWSKIILYEDKFYNSWDYIVPENMVHPKQSLKVWCKEIAKKENKQLSGH